jgi:hypothetical protein
VASQAVLRFDPETAEDESTVQRRRQPEATEPDGIVDLLRETVDGLGHLIAEHVNLARLELVTDVRRFGQRMALALIVFPVLVLGYGFLWLGAAVALGRVLGVAEALAVVGGLHLVFGGVGAAVLARRLRHRPPMMDDTAAEVGRTIAALAATSPARTTNGAAPPDPAPRITGAGGPGVARPPGYAGGVDVLR